MDRLAHVLRAGGAKVAAGAVDRGDDVLVKINDGVRYHHAESADRRFLDERRGF